MIVIALRAYSDSVQQYALKGAFQERYSLFVDGKMADYPLQQDAPARSVECSFAEAQEKAAEKHAHALCMVMNLKLLQLSKGKDYEIWDCILVVAQTRTVTSGLLQPIQVHAGGDFTFTGLVEAAWDTVGFGKPQEILAKLRTAMVDANVVGLPELPSMLLH